MSRSKTEIMRRLRVGNLRTLLRARCGHTLPNDDAGREYLWELLLPISLAPESDLKTVNAIETWAKWMSVDEARQLIDQNNRRPIYLRKPSARRVGERLRVTSRERELLKLWTIAPFDMTATQLKEQRKTKHRARMQRRRRAAGGKPRHTYLANSLTRTTPWKRAGISRRTWFRNRAKGHGTGPCALKLLNSRAQTSATEKTKRPKGLAIGVGQGRKERDSTESAENTESAERKARAVGS